MVAPDPPIMHGFPPPPEMRARLDTWDWPPTNRWAFCHVDEIMPTARLHRGNGPRSVFPRAPRAIDQLTFRCGDGSEMTVGDWLETSFTDGFIVVHRGSIVAERYFEHLTDRTLHLSQSVAKSVTGTAAGILIGRGIVDPDAPLTHWFPEFGGTGYDGATLRHVMDMASGVRFSEDYTDPNCDCAVLERLSGWKPPEDDGFECLFDFILTLPREAEHGSRMNYRSVETDVLGLTLERATGRRLPDLVSDLLWDPLGCEEDARFTVDAAGMASASGGFNATLRDYARFGEMLTQNGFWNGRQIVPAAFISETRRGNAAIFPEANWVTMPNGAYRNTFWNRDVSTRVLMGLGIFGQFVYSDPDRQLTVVKLSTWPEPTSDARKADTMAAIDAIAGALSA